MRRAVVVVVLAVLGLLAAGQRIQTVEVANSRYFISNASPYSPQLNWFLAYEYCRTIGMELLSFERLEETNQLTDFLRNNDYITSDYWTSGNQLGSEMWIWMSTGQPFNTTFNNWAAGGPPLTKSQLSCMSTERETWSAQNCMDAKHFICEQTRCFYYNYVTTNQGTPQGNTTILPGVTQVTSRPPLRPVRPLTHIASHQSTVNHRQQQQAQPNPSEDSPFVSNQSEFSENTVSISSLITTTPTPLKEMTPTPTNIKVMVTPSPLKIMTPTPPNIKVMVTPTPEQVTKIMSPTPEQMTKIMPPTAPPQGQLKLMSLINVSLENPDNATFNNEIIPTDLIPHLQLLQLPVHEFTSVEPDTVNKTQHYTQPSSVGRKHLVGLLMMAAHSDFKTYTVCNVVWCSFIIYVVQYIMYYCYCFS
ncbi:C-type lectin 37Da-like [Homarus americanus]|uniref:C-type lectin 37Da-like n=1 Tax=Homarus americanus TaxID=6706 RepID=A0A8J5T9N8_HOMAM|nr:C-type lectin 37Da-like [Homarus americanus]